METITDLESLAEATERSARARHLSQQETSLKTRAKDIEAAILQIQTSNTTLAEIAKLGRTLHDGAHTGGSQSVPSGLLLNQVIPDITLHAVEMSGHKLTKLRNELARIKEQLSQIQG